MLNKKGNNMLLEEVNKLINGYEKEVDFTKIDHVDL